MKIEGSIEMECVVLRSLRVKQGSFRDRRKLAAKLVMNSPSGPELLFSCFISNFNTASRYKKIFRQE